MLKNRMMKKYILLMSLCCFAFMQVIADTGTNDLPQDSVRILKKKLDLNMDKLNEKLSGMDKKIEEAVSNMDFSFDFDSTELLAMEETVKNGLSNMGENFTFNFNSNSTKRGNRFEQNDKTPTRIEKKSFSNISEIEFFHSYGNIIVKETNSNQVELEIQYFDTKNQKATCEISTTNRLLSINTTNTGKSDSKAKINYLVSVPKNVALNIDLKYGGAKMDNYGGVFSANLSYSNLSAQSFTNKPQLKMRYSDLKVEQAKDIYVSASYSDIRIKKADRVEVSGNYNDYYFEDVQTVTTGNSSSYGDIRAGTIGHIEGNLKYADVSIENLITSMDITTAYGDITIKNTSSKLKNINIKASYADVYITLPLELSATIDAKLSYGDLSVSKKYSVKYTESSEQGNRTIKKGQIGTKTPTANITVSNNYADIKIR